MEADQPKPLVTSPINAAAYAMKSKPFPKQQRSILVLYKNRRIFLVQQEGGKGGIALYTPGIIVNRSNLTN